MLEKCSFIQEFISAYILYYNGPYGVLSGKCEWIPKNGFSYVYLYNKLGISVYRHTFENKGNILVEDFLAMFSYDCYENIRRRNNLTQRAWNGYKIYEELEEEWNNKIPKMVWKKILGIMYIYFEKEEHERITFHDMFNILKEYPEARIIRK